MRRSSFVLLCLVFFSWTNGETVAQPFSPSRPASSSDLWRRWLDLIRDGEITKDRVERLFGVELTERRPSGGAQGAVYDGAVDYFAYRYWYLALTLSPKSVDAFLEWTAPFEHEEDTACVDDVKARRELAAIGFRELPPRPHSIRSPASPKDSLVFFERWAVKSRDERLRYLSGLGRTLRPPSHDRVFLCQLEFRRQEKESR